jgi:hypothetical protein
VPSRVGEGIGVVIGKIDAGLKFASPWFRRKVEGNYECSTNRERNLDRSQASTLVDDRTLQIHRAVFSTSPRTKELLAIVP